MRKMLVTNCTRDALTGSNWRMATSGVENRRRARHGGLWYAEQCDFLEIVLTLWALAVIKGLTPPVNCKRAALPLRNKTRPAKKRSGSCHSLNLAGRREG